MTTYVAMRIRLPGKMRKNWKQNDNFAKNSVKYTDITLANKIYQRLADVRCLFAMSSW